MGLRMLDVAKILGIAEPRGKFEAEIDVDAAAVPRTSTTAFGTVVFTYNMVEGLVDLVSVELLTGWRRHRLRGDELPSEFVALMISRACLEQEHTAAVLG